MTENYDPYADAVAERVNGILKQEFLLEEYRVDIDTMKWIVKDALRIYNTKSPHYSCYMKTPEEMHKQNKTKIRTYKNKDSCGDAPQLSHKISLFLSYTHVTLI